MIEIQQEQREKDPFPPRVKRLWEVLKNGEAYTVDELSARLSTPDHQVSKGDVRSRLTILKKVMTVQWGGEWGSTRYRLAAPDIPKE
jgi:hypothetical protein